MKNMSLHWKIIIAMILGIIWALISEKIDVVDFNINWLAPFGDMFMKMLKLIAVPLVLFSIIKGVSGLSNIRDLGYLGVRTITLYLFTTFCAVSIGLFLVNLIQPGNLYDFDINSFEKSDKIHSIQNNVKMHTENSPLQFLVDVIPSNIVYALGDNKAMLQIIFFAIFFGAVIVLIDKDSKSTLHNLVTSFNNVFLKMVDIVISSSPFFIFCLLSGTLSQLSVNSNGGIIDIILSLGMYSFVVLLGLSTMVFVVYPILIKFFIKNFSYNQFFKSIAPAQILAFSTSSSAATLPVTLDCVTRKLKVPEKVSSFVLPIGATVNMDGTSLYQCVAVVFLSQILGFDLSLSDQLLIALTAVLASIGSAAIPSAGLFMLVVVLGVTPIDPIYIAIILPVDRILDMCRTVVNVTGDASVCSVVASYED